MLGTSADRLLRTAYWTLGLTIGAIVAFCTRYYLNGDAINYIEMGESLRYGRLSGLVNLTESPGYAVLLGLGQVLLDTNRINDIPLLKVVNFFCFVLAMAACDLFVQGLRKQLGGLTTHDEIPLPPTSVSLLLYSMFLFVALEWVRVSAMTPDMAVFALMLVIAWLLLCIRQDPAPYARFVILGLALGTAYLFKSFLFSYAPVVFALAGSVTGSIRKVAPRVGLSLAVMIVVALPLITCLSVKVGRFSYGEVGNFGYVNLIGGKGEPIHPPDELSTNPRVLIYQGGPGGTYPWNHDLAYWTQGMTPLFDPWLQLRHLGKNVRKALSFSPWLIPATLVWLVLQRMRGVLRAGRLFPPSAFFVLMALAAPALGAYCLLHVEPRYLAPFFFLAFAATILCPRYDKNQARTMSLARWSSGLLAAVMLLLVLQGAVSQSMRGLYSEPNKISYRQLFLENLALKDLLSSHGVKQGDTVGIVGVNPSPPSYWARMLGTTLIAIVPDGKGFLRACRSDRQVAVDAMKKKNIKSLVGRGSDFAALAEEGWRVVPGSRDLYVLVLDSYPAPSSSDPAAPPSNNEPVS